MIKIQPAYSRIEMTETSNSITLAMPSKGLLSLGSLILLLSFGWLGFVVWVAMGVEAKVEAILVGAAVAVPGLMGGFVGLSQLLRRWTLKRDAVGVKLVQRGLFGTSVREWPTDDVSSFYTRPDLGRMEGSTAAWLVLGFRNNRSLDLLKEPIEEELRWVAAMMGEPRGTRKSGSTLQIAAEPERRKIDPEIVPPTLACRTYEGGVDLVFRPLLRAKGLWWRLPLAAVLGIVVVAAASFLLHRATHGAFPLAVPRLTIAAIVGLAGWRVWVLSKSAVIQVADGLVYVVENPGRKRQQFGMVDVEFVQTFRGSGHTELQFLLKGQPKVRLFDGRPPEELEWAARFLRVAIKGPHAPEAATMKVDAAAGECQVCLEKMDSRVVYCAKCRTPHHEECWSYMGMCSTYGCREIRFERK